jgi:hypothetical protein
MTQLVFCRGVGPFRDEATGEWEIGETKEVSIADANRLLATGRFAVITDDDERAIQDKMSRKGKRKCHSTQTL